MCVYIRKSSSISFSIELAWNSQKCWFSKKVLMHRMASIRVEYDNHIAHLLNVDNWYQLSRE